jgi:pimeloyl-ACP methyl ester carboxylesterase
MSDPKKGPIPYIDLGGSGKTIHFSHANGYPPECYKPLLSLLSKSYKVLAMMQRPLWQGSEQREIKDWLPFADDLLEFLDERNLESIIAIGHSMGAINSLRAAIRQPERFSVLVLIDPVLFVPKTITARRLLWSDKIMYRYHPLIQAARYRRREFTDLESIFAGYRKKSVFRYFDDPSLLAYVEGITEPKPAGGYRLKYSPEWEMRIYATGIWRDMDIWRNLHKINIPLLVIRGNESDTFLAASANLLKKHVSQARVITIDNSTHLVPMERPIEVNNTIQSYLQENL